MKDDSSSVLSKTAGRGGSLLGRFEECQGVMDTGVIDFGILGPSEGLGSGMVMAVVSSFDF